MLLLHIKLIYFSSSFWFKHFLSISCQNHHHRHRIVVTGSKKKEIKILRKYRRRNLLAPHVCLCVCIKSNLFLKLSLHIYRHLYVSRPSLVYSHHPPIHLSTHFYVIRIFFFTFYIYNKINYFSVVFD